MSREGSSPSYRDLFAALDLRGDEDGRSVYSPAAYLVELLALLEESFDGNSLLERRPDLKGITLDYDNTFEAVPYLDIALGKVLERLLPGAYGELRKRVHPLGLPFSLGEETLRVLLSHFQVTPLELYRMFTPAEEDPDRAAKEYLELSAEEVAVITGAAKAEADVVARYGLGSEPLTVLADAERFAAALGLTGPEVKEIVDLSPPVVLSADGTRLVWSGKPPVDWLDRINRLVRLAMRTGLTLTDLDLVLDSFTGGAINAASLRTVASVLRLSRGHGLTATEVCRLAVPVMDKDKAAEVRGCSGDILADRNKDYRFRLSGWITVTESEIVATVRRYREHYSGEVASPFDKGDVGLPEIGLIHRSGLLARALGVTVDELFDVLTVIDADLADRDCFALLTGGDPAGSLWLAETLFEVVGWAQAAGFAGRELAAILGGRPEPGDGGRADLYTAVAQSFEQLAFGPDLFTGGRFGERAAKVIHDVLSAYPDGVVSPEDDRLLRLDPVKAAVAAHDAITDLGVIASEDFLGLGLGERLQTKIYSSLVLHGVLHSDGELAVDTAEGLSLTTDFTAYRELLFKMIGAVVNGTASFFPSDLAQLDSLTQEEQSELYDNLIYNGYLDDDGVLTDPDFFLEPDNEPLFEVNVDLADAEEAVALLIDERLDQFAEEPLPLDLSALAALRLTDDQLAGLVESLMFNGVLTETGDYADKAALAGLELPEFGLALEFYPHRRRILDAMQTQILAFRTELQTIVPDDLADLADDVATARVITALEDGGFLVDGALVTLDDFDLGPEFTDAELETVLTRIGVVGEDEQPYLLTPEAVTELGFTDEETDLLFAALVEAGYLTEDGAVTHEWIAYFANPAGVYGFTLPGFEDYAADVFFLLNPVAVELDTAINEIVELLIDRAAAQREALHTALADVLGIPADTAEALCEAVAGGPDAAMDLLVAPALDPDAIPSRRAVLAARRIRRFALLAAKIGLIPAEVKTVFRDQDLTGKFPEGLTLPAGVRRFDALLEGGDGKILVFAGTGFWTYAAGTYALKSPQPAPLTELSPRFTELTGIDAAFRLPSGEEWLIGRANDGTSRSYTRDPGGTRWAPREQVWGKVKNAFDAPQRIDGAFADSDGRTFLFTGDTYVRYSTRDYTFADEGYPRPISEWRDREGLDPALAAPIDAFQDPDGTLHVLTGASGWGRVRNAFEGLERLDAAHSAGPAVHLFAGDQTLRYSDSVENDGVRADEGHPHRIDGVPARFESGIEACFTAPDGTLHLFKGGRTAAVRAEAVSEEDTGERWGLLPPALPSGVVDSALAGLDGRTYLFSGGTYLRFSTADYTRVDPGYPRTIASDWGGLTTVGASFVLDGSTFLFGTGGVLFDLPLDLHNDLASRSLTPALRARFAEHGLTLTSITGDSPTWTLTTAEGIALTAVVSGLAVKIRGDGARFYVRYSTRDCRTPDQGFPKPLSDNWWNLPDGLNLGPIDAVLTDHGDDTYLFAGEVFLRFDARHRWWSEPTPLLARWDSFPFKHVDAAFTGHDDRTYLFSGRKFVRYSGDEHTELDDGYPAEIHGHWDRVRNNIADTGRVDAGLVTRVTEKTDGVEAEHTYTYLFSGDQYFRYAGSDYTKVEPGYPRLLPTLNTEPGLAALPAELTSVDAAWADRRTVYLASGTDLHAVSAVPTRRYTDLGLSGVTCAFIEDGTIVTDAYPSRWVRRSALEGWRTVPTDFRPRTLRTVPETFRSGLDSVLFGADGNTYLFRNGSCHNKQLNRHYPIFEEWGRPRDTLYRTGAVDAAFTGTDGKTYLFSGDQFITYTGTNTVTDGDPRPIADHWAGLTSVAIAYVQDGVTHLYEEPDEAGELRHVVYSTSDYSAPDDGYPVLTDTGVFETPEEFPFPSAVLVENDTLILLAGEDCVSYTASTDRWSRVRPIERLFPGFADGVDAPDGLRSALKATDATYFFYDDTFARFADGAFGPLTRVQDRWGLSPNPFLITPQSTIDAAFVWRGEFTYLFSGNRYVRYTGPDYTEIDPGYPKKISVNLRREEPFAKLPESFEDDLLGKRLQAVIGNDRTILLILDDVCHAVSPEPAATYPLDRLGAIRNTVADTGKVDAALVAERKVYLLSGDQYVRYSTPALDFVDSGYPRPLESLADELDFTVPPERFLDGVDAALYGTDGHVYLFKGDSYAVEGNTQPVNGTWGKIANAFADGAVDAVLPGPSGELFVFRGGQYVRYRPGTVFDLVDPGYPRTFRDDWGDLPSAFEDGPDGAFLFEGRAHLTSGEDYVRYTGAEEGPAEVYGDVAATFPQPFIRRWTGSADYRLADLRTIVRFAGLVRSRPAGLAELFADGADDPFAALAALFGWDVEEVRWARRNSRLITPSIPEEKSFEIEFLLRLADLFGLAARFGTGPSRIHDDVWAKLPGDPDAASAALRLLLEHRVGATAWTALDARIHDRLNSLKRDALVAAISPGGGGAKKLFDRYLIDVEMDPTSSVGVHPAAATSPVREAIAATQLFLHRYLLDLETVKPPAGTDPDLLKDRIRTWWQWMKNYRIWEANRKVFLYPENYVRPELRDTKTPAFEALENDLLQNEITADSVQAAYKRYLDEYTEVSRLEIAGGYVYTADTDRPEVRRLVMFGKTRTDPLRYYVRSAVFNGTGSGPSGEWRPWSKVDVQITAERVAPVHAFGRVFMFWPVVETVTQEDPAKTSITTTPSAGGQTVKAPPPKYRVKICYSFQNLNGDWVAAQILAADDDREGTIDGLGLYVQASRDVPGVGSGDSIIVQCTYKAGGKDQKFCYSLTPELYGLRVQDVVTPVVEPDLDRIFNEPANTRIDLTKVIRFNAPADTLDGPWVSVDHKGGSFLCRPTNAPATVPTAKAVRGNDDKRLPTTWERIDAAFRLPDNSLYFFDAASGLFVVAPKPDPSSTTNPNGSAVGRPRQKTVDVFGKVETNLFKTGKVDAVFSRDGQIFVLSGDEYYKFPITAFGQYDSEYPKKIAGNPDNLGTPPRTPKPGDGWADNGPTGPVFSLVQATVTINNNAGTYTTQAHGITEPAKSTRELGRVPTAIFKSGGVVDGAYVSEGKLYLFSGNQYVRYTLNGSTIPEFIDAGYPKTATQTMRAVYHRDKTRYLFTPDGYARLAPGQELNSKIDLTAYGQNWRGLPPGVATDLSAALETADQLYLFLGKTTGQLYVTYPVTEKTARRPYEISSLPYQIVRLTSSTAATLNRRLLVGGPSALLDPSTQELNELPAFSKDRSGPTFVQVTEDTDKAGVPIGSHLDFDSSNGIYYWELFFHAPMLIARALTDAQRFDEARRWYEYVFDPTRRQRYWRFLPFLDADPAAIAAGCRADLPILGEKTVEDVLTPILTAIEPMAPAFTNARELTAAELAVLDGYTRTALDSLIEALAPRAADTAQVAEARRSLGERVELIIDLARRYRLFGDPDALLDAYYNDPFDPHTIARLRPAAYRRAVVMAYIDNLLEWGDMLFRQYTGESIDEARTLYVLAYDLLGMRPYDPAQRALPAAATYDTLDGTGGDPVDHLTKSGALLKGTGAVHAGVANAYFHVPGNGPFAEYWNRVEDRLRKIRSSLDIMGIARPVPLFEPPADVMALVRGVAGGATPEQVLAALAAPVPAYKFGFLYRRAQELADRLKQLGSDLLGAFERRDGEELALLQNRQEAAVRALTRGIKEDQIAAARESVAELRAALAGAEQRVQHYQGLIDTGPSPLEIAQIATMAAGAYLHYVSGGLKIGAAIATGAPQTLVGPFIMGAMWGGDELGGSLNTFSEVSSAFAEASSMIGETLGVRAEQLRQTQDWAVQLATARSDVAQIGHQVKGAEIQVAIALRELEILDKEAKNAKEIADFLTGKFAGAQLYGWMTGRLSGLYFQTYKLAHETARAAEKAYQFEQATDEAFVQPGYWESRRGGLLAAEGLSLDLDRLGAAQAAGDRRGLEITKQVSLLGLDPLALLAFRNEGRCEFALTEELFDRDFPGHFKRQIRTVSVTFETAEGPVGINATLSQLDDKTVMTADPKAVKFLLDPKGQPPASLRSVWRRGEEIALSDLEEGRDNNGLFELRYDDERYVPFEGTGAVSRWRLSGGRVPESLIDVTLTVKYTAEQGGDTFATAVKGMLRPYPTARYLDLATEFPDEWTAFLEDPDAVSITLPVTEDLLPGITGRQITSVTARYETDGDPAPFQLGALSLDDGRVVTTPGLTTGEWTLVYDADKSTLVNAGLIVAYRASTR